MNGFNQGIFKLGGMDFEEKTYTLGFKKVEV